MILLGLGGNLPSAAGGPLATCQAALAGLEAAGVKIQALSPWYETAPVPASDQPWFVNAVAHVSTDLEPEALLGLLHRIEAGFGRVREALNAARPLDLDLLAYNGLRRTEGAPLLPHPRLHERAFVLLPLRDVAPQWRHPVTDLTVDVLIARMPPGQPIRPLSR
jgi:2-amino-4-hydroxy-6-hydroxymethyldihydropteridine diphosphokinase